MKTFTLRVKAHNEVFVRDMTQTWVKLEDSYGTVTRLYPLDIEPDGEVIREDSDFITVEKDLIVRFIMPANRKVGVFQLEGKDRRKKIVRVVITPKRVPCAVA